MKINKALTFGVGLMLAGSISVNAQKVSFNGEQVSLKQAFQKNRICVKVQKLRITQLSLM